MVCVYLSVCGVYVGVVNAGRHFYVSLTLLMLQVVLQQITTVRQVENLKHLLVSL